MAIDMSILIIYGFDHHLLFVISLLVMFLVYMKHVHVLLLSMETIKIQTNGLCFLTLNDSVYYLCSYLWFFSINIFRFKQFKQNVNISLKDFLQHSQIQIQAEFFLHKYVIDTVKHVYSDHAYNEMTLIMKHLGIPGKHSL